MAPVQQDGLNVIAGYKDRRADYDRKTKFHIEEIKSEQIDKTKVFTQQALGLQIMQKMFS
jgi:hypothetical protein